MIFGPMAIAKNPFQGIMILMKSLLVQYCEKHNVETNHEIFRESI